MSENGRNARVSREHLETFCVEAMRRAGMTEADARVTAEVLVTNDSMGTFTHGTKQLLNLLTKNMLTGRLNPKAAPRVEREGSAWAIVDGNAAMPMVTAVFAMRAAIDKARQAGIAYVGVHNSNHFGAAGYYANMAAKEGMIGLAMSNCEPCMAVPGSLSPVLGTNPLAYAVPAGKRPAVLLDIALSTVAMGKVLAARTRGERIPDNWVADADGVPTSDLGRIPNYPNEGALLPMAGHKGYGLALLVEILSATLTGARMTGDMAAWWKTDSNDPIDQGHAFIAIHVNAIQPEGTFEKGIDRLIDHVKSSPKAAHAKEILLPGEPEWRTRAQAEAQGIALPADVWLNHKALAEQLGMDLSLLEGK